MQGGVGGKCVRRGSGAHSARDTGLSASFSPRGGHESSPFGSRPSSQAGLTRGVRPETPSRDAFRPRRGESRGRLTASQVRSAPRPLGRYACQPRCFNCVVKPTIQPVAFFSRTASASLSLHSLSCLTFRRDWGAWQVSAWHLSCYRTAESLRKQRVKRNTGPQQVPHACQSSDTLGAGRSTPCG